MAYHLKNASILRDIMATDPEFASDIVYEAIDDIGAHSKADREELQNLIHDCSKATTNEGIEMCLLLRCEDMAHEFSDFRHKGRHAFDDLLRKIDKRTIEHKKMYYDEHIL